jgi:hypothetical protein
MLCELSKLWLAFSRAALQAGVVSGGVYSGDVSLQMVPPLGSLRFIVEPRVLPLISSMEVRLDSSIKQMAGECVDRDLLILSCS